MPAWKRSAMANPEFHGNVPRQRCETCAHWERIKPTAYVGGCHNDGNIEPIQDSVKRIFTFTTDLNCCSGWKPKEE